MGRGKNKAGSGEIPALCLTNKPPINLAVKIRISVEKDKSEPVSNMEKVRICLRLVLVIGLEPARSIPQEPNGNVTSV